MKKSTFTPVSGITIEDLKETEEITAYLNQANDFLGKMGYTEHGLRHASLVGHTAQNILKDLGAGQRERELAGIAGYLHDIGNVIARDVHGIASALIAREILKDLDMPAEEVAIVMNAAGNHDEECGWPTSMPSAAVMIADKSDVHRSRVRNPKPECFDIHDRVNFAAKRSFLRVDKIKKTIALEIEIDTTISQVMEYFEIFLSRMIMCRRASEFLNVKFDLIINDHHLT